MFDSSDLLQSVLCMFPTSPDIFLNGLLYNTLHDNYFINTCRATIVVVPVSNFTKKTLIMLC